MYVFQRLALLFLLFVAHVAGAASPPEILILHSYSQEYSWTKNQHQAFVTELNATGILNAVISTEYLDTKRKAYDPAYISSFSTYLANKYEMYSPDIIYVTDDNALSFAMTNFELIFPAVPVVFSGVNNYSHMNKLDRARFTGVFEKKDILQNIHMLEHIDPSIKDIVIVGDGSNTYQAIESEIKQQLKNYPVINATFIAQQSIDDLLHRIKNQATNYVFLTTLGRVVDSSGHLLPLNETLATLADSTEATILSMEDAYVTAGILGGYVTSGDKQGKTAARLVASYLSGIAFDQLPLIADSPNEYMFDYAELEVMDIVLPDDILVQAAILNQPQSFYTRHRTIIIASIIGLTLILFFSLISFLIILSRKNRKIRSTSIQAQELEQIIVERTLQLQDEKRKLNQAQAIAHIGNYVWEPKDDKTSWSDELYNIVGQKPMQYEPSYQSYVQCIHEDDRQQFIQLTTDVLDKLYKYSSEYRIVRPDGDVRYIVEQGDAKLDEQGELEALVGVIHDITDRKRSEFESLRLQRELNQARKMEALGQLTGGIAHDFNNILAIILGYTDLILENYKHSLDPKLLSFLENVSGAASRASDLVSKMMVFSRSDKGIDELLIFAPLIEESINLLRSVIPSSIDIRYEFEDNLPAIMMDQIQLHQILMNLAINAKDAMDGSGQLEIKLRWQRQVDFECHACHKQVTGNWVVLSVADTGCGMTQDVVERIFEPFYTTKKVGQGTGMGMSVLDAIVESHGGHILIETDVDKGTTFNLFFPAATELKPNKPRDCSDEMLNEMSGDQQRILIVDDELALAGYLSEMLNAHGYVCTACTHSPEAFTLFESKPQNYDLVISDQTMPQLLGTDLIQKVWAINPHLPVILTTGYSDTISRQQAEAMGINYLEKPINKCQLLSLVAELLDKVPVGTDQVTQQS